MADGGYTILARLDDEPGDSPPPAPGGYEVIERLPDPPPAPAQAAPAAPPSAAQSFASHAGHGAGFGTSDTMQGIGAHLAESQDPIRRLSRGTGGQPTGETAYSQAYQGRQAELAEQAEHNPVASGLGTAVGVGAVTAPFSIAAAPTATGALVAEGALATGALAAGESEGQSLPEVAADVAPQAAVGGMANAMIPGAGRYAARKMDSFGKWVGGKADDALEASDALFLRAMGMERGAQKKIAQRYGGKARYAQGLRDQGVGEGFAPSTRTMTRQAEEAAARAGAERQAIEATVADAPMSGGDVATRVEDRMLRPLMSEDPAHLYHSTPVERIPAIREGGLQPARPGQTNFGETYGPHSEGQVFASREPGAWHRAIESQSKSGRAVGLRFARPADAAPPTGPDYAAGVPGRITGDQLTTRKPVAAREIEFFDPSGGGWRPLSEYPDSLLPRQVGASEIPALNAQKEALESELQTLVSESGIDLSRPDGGVAPDVLERVNARAVEIEEAQSAISWKVNEAQKAAREAAEGVGLPPPARFDPYGTTAPKAPLPGAAQKAEVVQGIADEFRGHGDTTFADMNRARAVYGDDTNFDAGSIKQRLRKNVYGTINESMEDAANTAQPGQGTAWRDAGERQHIAIAGQEAGENFLNTAGNRWMSPSDTGVALGSGMGMGAMTGDPMTAAMTAGAATAANKLIRGHEHILASKAARASAPMLESAGASLQSLARPMTPVAGATAAGARRGGIAAATPSPMSISPQDALAALEQDPNAFGPNSEAVRAAAERGDVQGIQMAMLAR